MILNCGKKDVEKIGRTNHNFPHIEREYNWCQKVDNILMVIMVIYYIRFQKLVCFLFTFFLCFITLTCTWLKYFYIQGLNVKYKYTFLDNNQISFFFWFIFKVKLEIIIILVWQSYYLRLLFITPSLNQILKWSNSSRLWFDDRKFRHKT